MLHFDNSLLSASFHVGRATQIYLDWLISVQLSACWTHCLHSMN